MQVTLFKPFLHSFYVYESVVVSFIQHRPIGALCYTTLYCIYILILPIFLTLVMLAEFNIFLVNYVVCASIVCIAIWI